jgi:hypothetical protein
MRLANQANAANNRRPDVSANMMSNDINGCRQMVIQNQSTMTPQLFSQNKPKPSGIGSIPTTMSNTFVQGNGTVPLTNIMQS